LRPEEVRELSQGALIVAAGRECAQGSSTIISRKRALPLVADEMGKRVPVSEPKTAKVARLGLGA
jgi:hypothetical protein